jgi:hypothetical protein
LSARIIIDTQPPRQRGDQVELRSESTFQSRLGEIYMKICNAAMFAAFTLGAASTAFATPAQIRGAVVPDNGVSLAVAPYLPNATITEGFDAPPSPGAACPVGWFCQNNSDATNTALDWFALTNFSTVPFPAQAGADAIAANFEAVSTGAGTISVWLVSPVVNFNPGATLEFWLRDVSDANPYPDRLQVRVSTAGAAAPNVGTVSGDVGDFTTLALDVNPSLNSNIPVCTAGIDDPAGGTIDGMPQGAWCRISLSSLSGIPTSGSGRIAFRYFVSDGGPSGTNSNAVVIDTFSFDEGTPGGGGGPAAPAIELPSLGTSAMIGLGALLAMFGFVGLRRRRTN